MKLVRCSRGFTVSLLVGVVFACADIRHDEFDCENAVAHMEDCCPNFNASAIDCSYSSYCVTIYPALDVTQSDCIRGTSCDALRANGVCDRVTRLPSVNPSDSGVTDPSVCTAAGVLATGDGSAGDGGDDATGGLGGAIGCASASNCAPGQICCFTFGSIVVSCVPPPCFSGIQACATSSECVAGETCAPTSLGFDVCQSGIDASLGDTGYAAISDATLDGSSEVGTTIGVPADVGAQ